MGGEVMVNMELVQKELKKYGITNEPATKRSAS